MQFSCLFKISNFEHSVHNETQIYLLRNATEQFFSKYMRFVLEVAYQRSQSAFRYSRQRYFALFIRYCRVLSALKWFAFCATNPLKVNPIQGVWGSHDIHGVSRCVPR